MILSAKLKVIYPFSKRRKRSYTNSFKFHPFQDLLLRLSMLDSFQGATFQIIIFMKKEPIYKMMKLMRETFWTIADIDTSEQKAEYRQAMKDLRFKFNFFHRIILLDIVLFLYGESVKQGVMDQETFPIHAYFPKFIPFAVMVIYLTMNVVLNVTCPVLTGILMFTSVGLAEQQFKILSRKFEGAFDDVTPNKNDKLAKDRLRECNQHLTNLVE